MRRFLEWIFEKSKKRFKIPHFQYISTPIHREYLSHIIEIDGSDRIIWISRNLYSLCILLVIKPDDKYPLIMGVIPTAPNEPVRGAARGLAVAPSSTDYTFGTQSLGHKLVLNPWFANGLFPARSAIWILPIRYHLNRNYGCCLVYGSLKAFSDTVTVLRWFIIWVEMHFNIKILIETEW